MIWIQVLILGLSAWCLFAALVLLRFHGSPTFRDAVLSGLGVPIAMITYPEFFTQEERAKVKEACDSMRVRYLMMPGNVQKVQLTYGTSQCETDAPSDPFSDEARREIPPSWRINTTAERRAEK